MKVLLLFLLQPLQIVCPKKSLDSVINILNSLIA